MKKERIDILLVEKGFFDSREKAKRKIINFLFEKHDCLVGLIKPAFFCFLQHMISKKIKKIIK